MPEERNQAADHESSGDGEVTERIVQPADADGASLLDEAIAAAGENERALAAKDRARRRRRTVAIAAAAVAVAAVMAGATLAGSAASDAGTSDATADASAEGQSQADQANRLDDEAAPASKSVLFKSTAEGWDQTTSTPLILHIAGATSDGRAVDAYRPMPAQGEARLDMSYGSYQITAISPVDADGSIYSVPETVSLTVEAADDSTATVQMPLARIQADQATQSQIESVLAQIRAAVNMSAGEASAGELGSDGASILSKALSNAANASAEMAAADSLEELQDAVGTASPDTSPDADVHDAADDSPEGDGEAVSEAYAQTTSDVGDVDVADASAVAQASDGADGRTWHDPVVRTVHHEAQTRKVYDYRSICDVCGADITGDEVEHTKAHAQAGEGGGWSTERIVTSIVVTPAYDSTETVVPGGWW